MTASRRSALVESDVSHQAQALFPGKTGEQTFVGVCDHRPTNVQRMLEAVLAFMETTSA
ncbi:hypothetical protein [Limnohabitans planktonicus]|uniref:hypothetical protein n=1 Tax=Limnohabitans planktonicus TaxID=540060 RepID=UPI000A829D53|nr:hypothetical protein [Limnohabitans planktonicus]